MFFEHFGMLLEDVFPHEAVAPANPVRQGRILLHESNSRVTKIHVIEKGGHVGLNIPKSSKSAPFSVKKTKKNGSNDQNAES